MWEERAVFQLVDIVFLLKCFKGSGVQVFLRCAQNIQEVVESLADSPDGMFMLGGN